MGNRSIATITPLLILALSSTSCSAPEATLEEGHPLTIAVRRGIVSGEKTFDHSGFDRLLRDHVTDTGMVHYDTLAANRGALEEYLGRISAADLEQYGREELLALLINAYNAYTLDWIVQNLPIDSIKKTKDPWKGERCTVGGQRVSLDFLEHQLLRGQGLFDEPRVHFGVNCASMGCPPLQNRAFTGGQVREELESAVRSALAQPSQLRVDGERVLVNQIFSWFGKDFRRDGKTLSDFLSPRAPAAAAEILREKGDAAISFIEYDWSLNAAE